MRFSAICLLFLIYSTPANSQWINEIHYDNTGVDVGECIEIAGPAGTNLAGWILVLYNGSSGASYSTINLSGTIPNESCGFGAIDFCPGGIQNGAPDGIALANGLSLIQFLSYEGTFTGTGGVAIGVLSTDIGVSENGTEAVGLSLQLTGSGSSYADFTWQTPAATSNGVLNSGQTISPCTSITLDALNGEPFVVSCVAGDNTGSIDFSTLGTYIAGNDFIVEMSDETGSFASPTIVGTLSLSGLDPSGNIPITIPVGANDGTAYRFRIVSTNPVAISSDNGVDIIISNPDSPCIPLDECIQIIQFVVDPENGENGTISNTGEFIQICNVCDVDIDMSCYVLCFTEDNTGVRRGDCIRIPDGTMLTAGSCYLMGGNGTNAFGTPDWAGVTLDLNWHSCGCVYDVDGASPGQFVGVLTDSGEDITLFNSSGELIDAITFGSGGGAAYTETVNMPAFGACGTLDVDIPPSASHLNIGSTPVGETNDEGWVYDCFSETWIFANHDSGDAIQDLNPLMTYDCAVFTPLPVTIAHFKGKNENRMNYLNWLTLSEQNASHYLIHRSVDGENWWLVGEVAANGNSDQPINYSITDFNFPYVINYYRLTTVDIDGTQIVYQLFVTLDNRELRKSDLVGIYNLLGQPVGENHKGLQIHLFEDGTTIKVYRD